MWRGCYGKEPFDLRLTVLRMFYQMPVILGVTLLGTVIFGGGYYVKNVLLRGERMYAASSIYRVEYDVEEERDVSLVHINQTSWNTYLGTDLFLEAVQAHLAESGAADGSRVEMSDGELAGTLEAFVASDLRMPSTRVTTESAEKSVAVAKAVEAAMTQEFAGEVREIRSIEVISSGTEAVEVIPDVRVGRAVGLSAVLSCFFTVILLLLKETGDDSIWLPSSLWKRYGLKTLGTMESGELGENIRYFFEGQRGESPEGAGEALTEEDSAGKESAEKSSSEQSSAEKSSAGKSSAGKSSAEKDSAGEESFRKGNPGGQHGGAVVCAVQVQVDSEAVAERLRQVSSLRWSALPSPLACPEVCRKLREAEGVLLAVRAGRHAGKQLERVLEYLAQQDCPVTAAILWDADERLIRRYYFLNRERSGRARRAEKG